MSVFGSGHVAIADKRVAAEARYSFVKYSSGPFSPICLSRRYLLVNCRIPLEWWKTTVWLNVRGKNHTTIIMEHGYACTFYIKLLLFSRVIIKQHVHLDDVWA